MNHKVSFEFPDRISVNIIEGAIMMKDGINLARDLIADYHTSICDIYMNNEFVCTVSDESKEFPKIKIEDMQRN